MTKRIDFASLSRKAAFAASEARRLAGAVRRGFRHDLQHASESYSQEGEDLVLKRAFEGRPSGFYVDVGAHHPMRFSNTYIFYRSGWRGINIDATPGSMEAFRRERPLDINIEVAISDRPEVLRYFTFHEGALNTFSEELARSRQVDSGYTLKGIVDVRAEPLADVLDRYLPPGQVIDFLTVDVEGWDLRALQSSNWDRFRPEIVVAEALRLELEEILTGELAGYLRSKGYRLFAKTYNSVMFRRA
jgi:FkbM family methyltransferase